MSPIEVGAIDLGSGLGPALLLALLLGLRHATDADHLAALATIAADPARQGPRAAARLGVAWSLGHAVTCFALGLAVVRMGQALPPVARLGAELAVGLLIVALAVRLLARWRYGRLHSHEHHHREMVHRHPHLHEAAAATDPADAGHVHASHSHAHAEGLGRTPLAAFGIGLVHGVGGSALGAALLATTQESPQQALALLATFCLGTVISMAGVSAAVGLLFGRARGALTFERVAPVIGVATFSFGTWYVVATCLQMAALG